MEKQDNLELIKLNNLLLSAKIISERLKQGHHLGKRVGHGAEFEQYRHYEPGDDLKKIDWKLFARSEKYQIKESPIESNLHVRLMLDLSGSMNYKEDGNERLALAKVLLASIAYIANLQGDSLSLFFLKNEKVEQVVAPGPKSLQQVLYHLEKATAKGKWELHAGDFPALKSREKELVILVSDFLQHSHEWEQVVKAMIHPNKEITLFQLLGKQEMHLEMKGNVRFADLESSHAIHADAGQLQVKYNMKIAEYLKQLESNFELSGTHFYRAGLDEPIVSVIHRFISKRKFV